MDARQRPWLHANGAQCDGGREVHHGRFAPVFRSTHNCLFELEYRGAAGLAFCCARSLCNRSRLSPSSLRPDGMRGVQALGSTDGQWPSRSTNSDRLSACPRHDLEGVQASLAMGKKYCSRPVLCSNAGTSDGEGWFWCSTSAARHGKHPAPQTVERETARG